MSKPGTLMGAWFVRPRGLGLACSAGDKSSCSPRPEGSTRAFILQERESRGSLPPPSRKPGPPGRGGVHSAVRGRRVTVEPSCLGSRPRRALRGAARRCEDPWPAMRCWSLSGRGAPGRQSSSVAPQAPAPSCPSVGACQGGLGPGGAWGPDVPGAWGGLIPTGCPQIPPTARRAWDPPAGGPSHKGPGRGGHCTLLYGLGPR